MKAKILVISFLLSVFRCDTVEPPPASVSLRVEALGASSMDARLRVTLENKVTPRTIAMLRDGDTVLTFSLTTTDTTLIDDGLTPSTTYTYQALRYINPLTSESSTPVQLATLGVTGHEFDFEIDSLGDGGSSVLFDVAIVNDTLVYVVGEMYLRDSTGQLDPILYNLAIWNGTEWQIQRLPYYYQGSPTYSPIRWIFAVDDRDIWFGNSVRWDGQRFLNADIGTSIFAGVASNRMWGSANGVLHVVGNGGVIAYSPDHGSSWQRIESGTTLDLVDVWGVGSGQIHATGIHYGESRGVVLEYDGQSWQTLIEGEILVDTTELFRTKLYGITEGLWIDELSDIYTVGNLMYRYRNGKWDYVHSLQGNVLGGNPNFVYRGYLHGVRGNASNDMIVVGEINTLRHFDGVTWSEVGPPYNPLRHDTFWYRCAMKGNLAIGVGTIGDRGAVIRLWR